jgi:hypothetical protein
VEASSAVILHLTSIGGTFTADDRIKVEMTGYGLVVASHAAAATADGVEDPLTSFNAPAVPGTYTLVATLAKDGVYAASTDLTTTVTMTVTAPSAFSASLSKAWIVGSATATATADTDLVTASGSATMAAANRGSILLTMKNGLGGDMASGNAVTAQITSGPGYLVALTADTPTANSCSTTPTYSATVGRAISAFAADALNNLIICADGTAGVATIKVSVTNQLVTTELATKSFTFFGAVRSLSVAAANYTIGVEGGDTTGAAEDIIVSANYLLSPVDDTTDVPAIIIAAKDSTGQLATAASVPTVISSNLNVVSSGACELDDGSGAYSSGEGFGLYNCSFTTSANAVSGQSATLTFRIADPLGTAGVDFLTTTQVVTVGGARYTETVALDKTSYAQGEAMVVTRTAKDKAGNPVYDGASAPAVVFNKAIGGTAPGSTSWYTNGTIATSSSKPTVFAPTASGVFEARITGYNGSSTATSAIIAKATVGDDSATVAAQAASDAAAEAIDAANAATDAANLAAEAADAATVAAEEARDAADAATAAVEELATQVATLMAALKAQITTLANTVAKIAKKVKA